MIGGRRAHQKKKLAFAVRETEKNKSRKRQGDCKEDFECNKDLKTQIRDQGKKHLIRGKAKEKKIGFAGRNSMQGDCY